VGLLGVLAETISLARAVGVDPARFLEAIEGGPLGAPYAQMKGQMMIEGEYPTSFSASLARKDASLVLDAAQVSGLRLPMTEAAATHFDEAIDAGHGEEDMAAVYQAARPDRG
jgi:3-hydroxyisobutyrate dehydrogenase